MEPVEQYLKLKAFISSRPANRYMGSVALPYPESDYIRVNNEELWNGLRKLKTMLNAAQVSAVLRERLLLSNKDDAAQPVMLPCVSVTDWVEYNGCADILLAGRSLKSYTYDELVALGRPAMCGVINENGPQTVVDHSVRSAYIIEPGEGREIVVDDNMMQLIYINVNTLFPNRHVKVELDKVNVYGPGHFFAKHVDAPKPGVIGSVVMCTTRGQCSGGDLCFYEGDKVVKRMYISNDRWCGAAFLSSMMHSVTQIVSGHRVSVTFYIKQKMGEPIFPHGSGPELPTPLGILLTERYSLNEIEAVEAAGVTGGGALKGRDRVLYSLVGERGYLLPVIVDQSESASGGEDLYQDYSNTQTVYRFTRDDYEKFMTTEKLQPVEPPIPFVWATELGEPTGEVLHTDHQSYCEYTGNESQPEIIDNLYYTTALIL